MDILLEKSKLLTVDLNQEVQDVDEEMSMHCVTCGHEIHTRTAVKHMEKCFNKVCILFIYLIHDKVDCFLYILLIVFKYFSMRVSHHLVQFIKQELMVIICFVIFIILHSIHIVRD